MAGELIDNILLENGDNLLLEDGISVYVLEGAVPQEATATAPRGHISRRKPHIVFVDQEEEPEEIEVPERRMLRMTPEVTAMLRRYRKDKDPQADGGLLGNKKGLV